MPKISVPLTLTNLKTIDEVTRWIALTIDTVKDAINGGLTFGDNVQVALVTQTFSAANQELRFDHTLNRIADNYIIVKASADLRLFDGSTSNVKNSTYIKASGAGTVTAMMF